MAEDFKQSINEANQGVESIITSLEKLDQKIIETSNKAAQQLGNVSKIISPNDMNAQLQKQQALIDSLNKELSEQKELLTQLTTAKRTHNKATSEEIIGQRELKKSADLQAKSTMKLVGAYQNLIAKQRQARTTLRNLIASGKASNREIKKAQKEYDRLSIKVNKANKATSNFSKSGLGGMVRGFRNLIGAFGILAGTQLFATMTKSVFQLTKTLNSMDFAMKAVITDGDEFAQTQEFLNEITNNFGAELVTTTNRYIKFRAASLQAGLSAKETQNIFGTMTKAAGVLGLKTDELTGIFLALEQMVSKGKITTEELRRQLGERLPGAMDIMANSLGVTTAKLDEMLKKGEVITAEVLPGFARQVEVAFGLQSIKKVETLQASTIRLQNAWTNLVKNMEGSEKTLSTFFSRFIDGLASILEGYKSLSKVQSEYVTKIRDEQVELNKLVAEIISTNEEEEERGILIDKLLDKYPFFLQALKDEKTDNDSLRDALDRVNNMYIKRLAIRRIEEQLDIEGSRQREAKAIADLAVNQKAYNDLIIDLNTQLKGDISGRIGRNLKETADNVIRELKRIRDEQLAKGGDKSLLLFQVENALKKIFDAQKILVGSNFMRDIAEETRKSIQSQIEEFEELLGITGKQIDEYFNLGEVVIKTNKKISENFVGFTTNSEKAFKKNIAALKNLRDSVKKGGEEWKLYGVLIKAVEAQSKLLGDELEKTGKIITNSENAFKKNIDVLKEQRANVELNSIEYKILDSIIKQLEITFKGLKGELDEFDLFTDIFGRLTETFSDIFDIDMSAFEFLFDSAENTVKQWGELSKQVIGSVLDASLKRYEVEIQQAQIARDLILENDLASEEEKENARKKFDQAQRAINARKAREERDNNLIKIAIDTASAIVEALPNIPLSIAVGAIGLAQASFVASQPLPKFERGTSNAPKGFALTQEKRAEPITDMYGRLKTMGTDDGTMITPLEKGDKVYTSRDEFFRQNSSEAINKAVWNMNMASNGQELSKKFVDNSLLNEIKGLRKDNVSMNKKIMKLGSRPINNNVTVEIKNERAY